MMLNYNYHTLLLYGTVRKIRLCQRERERERERDKETHWRSGCGVEASEIRF